MAKNIVVFCDGTGNDRTRDDFDTNVAMLYERALHSKQGEPTRQVTYYDAGVGTEMGDLIGKATGNGISQNIQQAYDFIVRYYDPGDHIFVFGFSRGAYTVRSLAGMIGLVGVPRARQTIDGRSVDLHDEKEKARGRLVAEAYAIYKITDADERKDKARKFRETYGPPEHADDEKRAVHFIGVWDTVRSLGIPVGYRDVELTIWPHRFHDHELSEHVRYAYHALSIDDDRIAFHPTLWNEPTKAQKLAKPGEQPKQKFEQVWFAGVHSDVGGGYKERGLADITLRWMMERALAAEPPLLLAPDYADDPFRGISPKANDTIHDPRDKAWKKVFYRREARQVCKGVQEPNVKAITANGDAEINKSWLERFVDLFADGTFGYDPPSVRDHPDVRLARDQMGQAARPLPGPFKHFS